MRQRPNGQLAASSEEAQAEWRQLHQKLEAYFPGWQVQGWNPNIRLVKYDDLGRAQYCDIAVDAAEALRSPSPADYWWTNFGYFWNRLGSNYRFDSRSND